VTTGPRVPLPDLPVVEAIEPLRAALREHRRAILVAPPGAGKTTVIPLALLDEDWLGDRRIVVLEPRRLATRAAARRMAETTGTSLGSLVGYQTRDERRIDAGARIEVVTEGVLTRRLQHDPELPGVGLVVFDEVHERNLPTDLGLALTLDVAASIRPDLRLLAMSATPDVAALTALLDAPLVESEGRTFDIDVRWRPSAPAGGTRGRRPGGRPAGPSRRPRTEDAVAAVVHEALRTEDGDVLVFLPGIGEIRRTATLLEAAVPADVDVRPLAGALPRDEQDLALAPSPPGRRRVVLATDIAETSLTVAGIRVVVDSGLAREPRFDPRTGMSRLTTVTTSRASADQRAGRAGRTEPGVAYRLWSKLEHGTRPRHRRPEILDTDLAGLALELAAWGSADLGFVDPPPAAALAQGRELLTDLHALDADGAITALGRSMLTLPVHPRLARMIAVDRTPLSCVLATIVDERDVLRGRPDDLPADLALRVGVVAGRTGHDGADRGAVARLRERSTDLLRRAGVGGTVSDAEPDRAGAVLLLAYPDRLAMRRRPGQFLMRSGGGAWLPDHDPLADEQFVVAADLDGRRERARIRLGAALDADDVLAVFGDEVVERRELGWDTSRDDLVESVERRLGAIALGRVERRPAPGEETTAALMARARDTRLEVLDWTPAAQHLRARVDFLHRVRGEPWPDWSAAALTASVDDWLAPYLPGATGRADLERLDLTTVLRSQLPWPDGADLDELVPAELPLPTGRRVAIDYTGEQPDAFVRVQDLFGVTVHPLAGGVPIRLHLLSPADRPIQVTSDLPGFWRGSWADVRKDMAGRYPKHHWPDDPGSADPRRMKGR
jgi:ATP-dependent helicase HrpB